MNLKMICAIVAVLATSAASNAATLKNPSFRMTEAELIAVLKENGLNDKVTACQELSHAGTKTAVPHIAAHLADEAEPALFHAALFALENIPGPEAEAALAAGMARCPRRAAAIEASLRRRKESVPKEYVGADAVLTAFPPKSAVQKGDLAVVTSLVDTAVSGTGFDAVLARRHLVGFPDDGIVERLLAFAEGSDAKKAQLAVSVLGTRRASAAFSRIVALARSTKNDDLREETFKALATMFGPKDIPQLVGLLKQFPNEERLSGTIVRVASQAFETDKSPITVAKAEYGFFGNGKNANRRVVDVLEMVRSLLSAGARSIMASNRLSGQGGFPYDPAPGVHKELRLVYRVGDGPEMTAYVQESEEICLTETKLAEATAKPLIAAALAATGDEKAALVRIIGALDRRGAVQGAEQILFQPIFNGRDLAGWSQKDGFFTVRDGVIVGESTAAKPCRPNHHLVYVAEELSDFELRAEFRLSKNANSGIQLRCAPQLTGDNGYQADMNGDGSIVGFVYHPKQHLVGQRGADVAIDAAGKKQVVRFADGASLQGLYRIGQWNEMKVKVEGRSITVWINGVRTASVTDARTAFLPEKGCIALQLHQGPQMKVEYRNLRVRKL